MVTTLTTVGTSQIAFSFKWVERRNGEKTSDPFVVLFVIGSICTLDGQYVSYGCPEALLYEI